MLPPAVLPAGWYALGIGVPVADAIREGYHLNLLERTVPGSAEVAPLMTVNQNAVVVSPSNSQRTVPGDIVVRYPDALDGRIRTTLTPGFDLAAAVVTDQHPLLPITSTSGTVWRPSLRGLLPEKAAISLVRDLAAVRGHSDFAADRDAVRRIDALANRIFLDPVFYGHYPPDLKNDTA